MSVIDKTEIGNPEKEWNDPIVAEVRAARDAYSKKFNYDIRAMCADIIKGQEEFKKMGFCFTSRKPKKLQARTGTDR